MHGRGIGSGFNVFVGGVGGCGFNAFVGGVGGCGRVSPRGERQACLSFLQVLVVVSLLLSLLLSVLSIILFDSVVRVEGLRVTVCKS